MSSGRGGSSGGGAGGANPPPTMTWAGATTGVGNAPRPASVRGRARGTGRAAGGMPLLVPSAPLQAPPSAVPQVQAKAGIPVLAPTPTTTAASATSVQSASTSTTSSQSNVGNVWAARKQLAEMKLADAGSSSTSTSPTKTGETQVLPPQQTPPTSTAAMKTAAATSSSSTPCPSPRTKVVPMTVIEHHNEKLKTVGPAPEDATRMRPMRDRNAPANKFRPISIKANHFPVTFNVKAFPEKVYHYDVVITPKDREYGGKARDPVGETTVPDRLLHVIWRTFEERFHTQLGARMPFDGKKNCYTAKMLNFSFNHAWIEDLKMKDPDDDDKMRTFTIQLKFAGEVKTDALFHYLRSCNTWERCELPQDVIQALDVALRYSPSLAYIPCNRGFYSPDQAYEISKLLEVYFGHNQSLLVGRDEKATLNIDMANKAFLKRMSVVDVLAFLLRKDVDGKAMNAVNWRPGDLQNAESFLKSKLLEYGTGRKVDGKFEKYHRFVAVGVASCTTPSLVVHSARSYTFEMGEKKVSIAEYFANEKNIILQHPDWPVIHVGNKNMTNYVPMELLYVMPQPYKGKLDALETSAMIKASAKKPEDRFQRIQKSRNKCKFETCSLIKEFGMEVSREMIEIRDARKIPLPMIETKSKGRPKSQEPPGADGKFQVEQYCIAALVPKIGVLNASGRLTDKVRQQVKLFLANMGKEARNRGMGVDPSCQQLARTVEQLFENAPYEELKAYNLRGALDGYTTKMIQSLRSLKEEKHCQLVIVIMGRDGSEYSAIKSVAETKLGILTQCVRDVTVEKVAGDRGRQVAINILLKLNAKLNGVSFRLAPEIMDKFNFMKEPVLILGADVTHPAPNSKSPSVAAVSASYDLTNMCYQMRIQIQEAAVEVINELAHIIKDMIVTFKKRTTKVPKRIIMFRDGVSEGQFPHIKEQEYQHGILRAIELINADYCKQKDYMPKVTFIVVKKRHHTRFTPVDSRDSVRPQGNIPPGTVVDTVITHPTEREYFLNSHVGIQGTSKPTRYHVIHDDSEFSLEMLEQLTYYLCYTFVRCAQPVSYPAPTYYAHLAAFRARALLEMEGENADIAYLQKQLEIKQDLCSKYPMFFV